MKAMHSVPETAARLGVYEEAWWGLDEALELGPVSHCGKGEH